MDAANRHRLEFTTMPMPANDRDRLPSKPGTLLEWSVRLALAAIFLGAGAVKLAEPKVFALLIDAYGILPAFLVMPVALILPILEIVAAIGTIMNRRGSLYLMTALMVIFVAVLAYGLHLGLDVDCGCFGPEDLEAKAFHGLRSALHRDMVIMVGIVFLYFRRRRQGKESGGRNQVDGRRKRCASKVS
ncbi:MAG: MauE/DoxX family redox-associated membrane protein [Desulfosarcinaceae bacterium]